MIGLTGLQNIQALQQSFAALAGSAQRVAQSAASPDLLNEQILQLNVRQTAVAQVKVLQAADEILASVIDLRA